MCFAVPIFHLTDDESLQNQSKSHSNIKCFSSVIDYICLVIKLFRNYLAANLWHSCVGILEQ